MRGDVQGITTLVGTRLGKTLTIKLRVWDLAMLTNDTQDKKDARGPFLERPETFPVTQFSLYLQNESVPCHETSQLF